MVGLLEGSCAGKEMDWAYSSTCTVGVVYHNPLQLDSGTVKKASGSIPLPPSTSQQAPIGLTAHA